MIDDLMEKERLRASQVASTKEGRHARRSMKLIASVIAAGGLLLLPVGAASAAQTSTSAQQDLNDASEVQENYLAGTVTAEDEAWVEAHPDLAAYIVDPSKTVLRPLTNAETERINALAAGCTAVNAFAGEEYGLGGLHLYTYISTVSHCYDATHVTDVPTHSAYFQSMAAGIVVNDHMARDDVSFSGANAYVTHQGQAQWCTAPVGCVFTYHPKIEWTLSAWAPDEATFTH
ncbi:MAG: hypothetical protein ACTIKT_06045 [Microbacterium sp.]